MGRFFRRVSIALVALMVVTGAAAGGAVAKGPRDNTIVADLDGRRISVSEIPDWFCHDLDFPLIHCYTTAAQLDAALHDAASGLAGLAAGAAGMPYVYVYGDAGTLGPAYAVSQAWDNLSSIGWNDKISSFKALNGLSGHFATDAYNSGRLYPTFCCNTVVTYVGDFWNDQFSSVYPW
jgi:hypothetical protein